MSQRERCAWHPTGFYPNGQRCVIPPPQKPAPPDQLKAAVAGVIEELGKPPEARWRKEKKT